MRKAPEPTKDQGAYGEQLSFLPPSEFCPILRTTNSAAAVTFNAETARPVDELEQRRQERESAEQARSLMFRRNSAAIVRVSKYSLGWGRCRGALGFKPPKFHRIESDLGRMCFELPPSSPDGRVLPRTILGTLVGHDSKTSLGLADLRDAFAKKIREARTHHDKSFVIAAFKLETRAQWAM